MRKMTPQPPLPQRLGATMMRYKTAGEPSDQWAVMGASLASCWLQMHECNIMRAAALEEGRWFSQHGQATCS